MATQLASAWRALVGTAITPAQADAALDVLAIDPAIGAAGAVTRADMAMALNVALFADLLTRVPSAADYVGQIAATGERITVDHGALRVIAAPDDDRASGAWRGVRGFSRILEPLGYELAGLYPLPRLRMTGRSFVQRDLPEAIPQFFVSELHLDLLAEPARAIAERVFATARDPLGAIEVEALAAFARDGACDYDLAARALPGIVAAFGRHHDLPDLADYTALLDESREAAWIATEGNAFNHATTRVPDVVLLAGRLRAEGKPIKAEVEVSANRRVRQTAFIADTVVRRFAIAGGSGGHVDRGVPGSFYEFISRDVDPATGRLDLSFDSGNATGIFAVTSGR